MINIQSYEGGVFGDVTSLKEKTSIKSIFLAKILIKIFIKKSRGDKICINML